MTRTCEFPLCDAQPDDDWSTGIRDKHRHDPTEQTGFEVTYHLCPEHRDYQVPSMDVETYPCWDPHWGPVPEWVVEERRRGGA